MANSVVNSQTQIHFKQLSCSSILFHLSFCSLKILLFLSLSHIHPHAHTYMHSQSPVAKLDGFPLKFLSEQADRVQVCHGQRRQGHGQQTGVCVCAGVYFPSMCVLCSAWVFVTQEACLTTGYDLVLVLTLVTL